MANLASNPSGSISGQPGPDNTDALGIVNQLKDREMRDFQNKANFMSELSLKQDRQRMLFDPANAPKNPSLGPQSGGPQQSSGITPGSQSGQMNPQQTAEMSMRQQGMDLDKAKLAQAGKMGEERIANQTAQEKLNQQKSDQIHEQKQNELQAKITEANGKLTQAQAKLEATQGNAEATLAAHKDLAAAVEERHKLEIDNLNHRFEVTSGQHQQTIDNLTEQLKQRGNVHEVKKDAQGNEITTDIKRGSAANMVNMKGRDGKTYPVPADKAEEAKTHPFFKLDDAPAAESDSQVDNGR
jgi:hypothetical protein